MNPKSKIASVPTRSALTDFLLARIAEEGTLLGRHRSAPSYARMYWDEDSAAWPILVVNADHALAECAAKRQIVDNATNMHTSGPDWDQACRILALPYADHPDYREEWKP